MAMPLPLPMIVETLARLVFVSLAVLVLWPRYALSQYEELRGIDQVVANVARVVLTLMVVGYALTAVRLFSWLLLVVALFALRFTLPRRPYSRYELSTNLRLAARLLEELDALAEAPARLLAALRRTFSQRRLRLPRPSAYAICAGLLFAAVLIVSVWMRFWSNVVHATPPYSDFNVVLYWVKEIAAQQLFPNGIYPEGFHILMAALQKLVVAPPLTFVKFFGPAVGVFMVASVGYTTYRMTGKLAPAIIATLVYGTLPLLLPYDYYRQSGTDSQEFGNALVLPLLYFTYQAWMSQKPGFRIGSVSLLAIVALTHPVSAMNAVCAAVAATLAAWLFAGIDSATLRFYVRTVLVAALVSLLPIGIGLAIGLPFNGSSATFIGATTHIQAPPLTLTAKAAIASCGALFALRLVRRGTGGSPAMPLSVLLTLGLALLIQQSPRFGLHSLVLTSRSGEFVALAEALAFGLGWCFFEELLQTASQRAVVPWISLICVLMLTGFAWKKMTPQPFNPYRMYADAFAAQYAQIEQQDTRATWLAISDNGGYDYAVGDGFFIPSPIFLQHVRVNYSWPHYQTSPQSAPYPLYEKRIYFFIDTRIIVPHLIPNARSFVLRRELVRRDILAWMAAWQKLHGPIPVVYNGPDLRVYELVQKGVPLGGG